MPPVVGGGLTALGWGSADFIARFTGQALGYATALFGMLVASAIILTLLVWYWGLQFEASAAGWSLSIVYGIFLLFATLLLYNGLARGPVTVVAPIVGSFPAFNLIIALFLGTRPSSAQWASALLVMAGVIIVARSAEHYEEEEIYSKEHLSKTIMLALGSSLLFGLTVAAGQEAGARFGETQTVFVGRWVAVACCITLFVWQQNIPTVPWRWWPVLVCQGVLDGGAYLALLAGSQGAGSALTAVVASTFSAVTVVLARVILRESMSWLQWGGIVAIVSGVAMLSYL
ncbi:MAG: DMT family transporter [Arenicellales bacterium]|nr:DMT family transporter [Arenicellales bacterium]